MGRIKRAVILVLALCLIAAPVVASEQSETQATNYLGQEYLIGPGDILDVSVWKNEDLTKLVPVLPDGTISFPLIGEIVAQGKTVARLRKELEGKIVRYMPDPIVTVAVQKVNSLLVYVIGKVNRPGIFPLSTNVNVLQALAMAQGLNTFAKRNKIKIFREEGDTTRIFDFQYDEVSEGANLEQNIQLQRGDIIVVP